MPFPLAGTMLLTPLQFQRAALPAHFDVVGVDEAQRVAVCALLIWPLVNTSTTR